MIVRLQESYPVTVLCHTLQVHRSSFRAWLKRDKRLKPLQTLPGVECKAYEDILTSGNIGSSNVHTVSCSLR